MTILQIVSKLDTSDAAEDVISSTKFLTLNGHKAVVVSEESSRVREIDEVGARHYSTPLKSNIMAIPFSIFKISRIISKEDIQIVHARCPVSSFVAFFAARFTARPFISTIYGHNVRGIFGRSQGWAKRIVLFSEAEAQRLVRTAFVSQERARVIPPFVENGDSAHFFMPNYEKNGRCPHFTIGAALPLCYQETTQNFIKAVSTLSRTIHKMTVFVMDETPANAKDGVERLNLLVKRHSLDGIVTFLSREEEKGLPSWLDLFVHINPDENVSPKLLLRAFARRIPVITTPVNWLGDYAKVQKSAFLTCQTADSASLTSAVLGLYRDEKQKNEMLNEATEFVKENFNQRKIMASLLDLYQEVISSANMLIIKIGALGDVILAVPSLRAIREKFPKSKITVLVGIENREALANSPYIDDITVCDWEGRDRGLGGLLAVARRLRAKDFDTVIDFQNNKRSHLLSFLSCAPKRYGYDNGKLSFLLNRKIKDAKTTTDPIEHQSKILNLLGIFNIDKRLELWPSEGDEKWADAFMESHWVKGKDRVIAVNIGSSPRWITKLWPVEYFAEICNRLAQKLGVRTLVIGLKDESQRTEEFLKCAKCKPIDALGRTNIPRLAALVKKCSLLISSDSAPIHIAAAVGTPCIALFGPTDPSRHLAPAENFIVFKKDLRCSPCYRTYCNMGYECMKLITPDEVYEAAVKLLGVTVKNRPG